MTRKISLFQLEPDLRDAIPDHERAAASQACFAPSFTLPTGSWEAGDGGRPREDPGGFGLLLFSGVPCRRVAQAERAAAELIGPGDLIRPWDRVTEWSTLPVEATWTVLRPVEGAVLDRAFGRRVGPYPAIAEQLVRRALLRTRYLSVLSAITGQRSLDSRLHMLFWHLADRFGRMRGEWVEIPIPLTHSLLAELVAARRPSVSTAFTRLQGRGVIEQERGGWRLSGTVPPEYAALRARQEATTATPSPVP
jgi:CRP/FNR family cyclic AMP-dependent transcriptional regulator